MPFSPAGLDRELDVEARRFLSEPRNVEVDAVRGTVRLSSILKFYTEDFLAQAPSLIAYTNRYRADAIPEGYAVRFIPYDWTLNQT